MKRIALAVVALGAATGTGYVTHPEELQQSADAARHLALRAWANVEANPTPVGFALGTFLLTVVYHKARGKSFRESVEVAATRVAVISVPSQEAGHAETTVVRRAKARATRTQLLADQIGIENRMRKLPDAITRAEKDVCFAENALVDAERAVEDRRKVHNEAVTKLDALREEKAGSDAELAEIDAELRKLAEVV